MTEAKCVSCQWGDPSSVLSDTSGESPHRWPVCESCVFYRGKQWLGEVLTSALVAVLVAVAVVNFFPPRRTLDEWREIFSVREAVERETARSARDAKRNRPPKIESVPPTATPPRVAEAPAQPETSAGPHVAGRMFRNSRRSSVGRDGRVRIADSHGARNPRVDMSEFAFTHALNGDI